MLSSVKSKHFQGVKHHRTIVVLAVLLATVVLPLRNTLQAANLTADSVNTVARMDSLFRTVYNPLDTPGKGKGWKPFNRMEWFYGQRAFPSGNIPAMARMDAWQAQSAAHNVSSLDESWTLVGPPNMAGRMLCLAWHPTNTNILYAGAASGGLWKSTSGGSSWVPLTDALPSLAVGAVALDPTNPNTLYIGTGEGAFNVDAVFGAGIFKSTDAGVSWTVTGMNWEQAQGRAVNKIIVHPANGQTLWAATNITNNGGVFKSTDGGTTWTRTLTGDAKDLVLHPDSANVLFTVIGYPWGGATNGVYRSSDGGATWALASTGLPAASTLGRMALGISRSNPQTLYVGVAQTISAGAGLLGLYRSTNSGASWNLQAAAPNVYGGQGWYNIACEVNPANPNVVFSSGLDCYKSTDAGLTWVQKSYGCNERGTPQYAHGDHHALAFKPGDPNTVIVVTDGGLYKSTNGGDTWTDLNSGLATFQFYTVGQDVLNSSVAFGGTQDNGTVKYTGVPTWTTAFGGDGGYCLVDYTNSNIVYGETQRGSHLKSTNGGSTWTPIQSGITGSGAWVTPVVMDPANPNILYTATTQVYKTTSGGASWTAISPAFTSRMLSTLAVSPADPQVIWAGSEYNGEVRRTTDGGASWQDVSANLPYAYVTRIAAHPTDGNAAVITFSGYEIAHVWKTTNGGASWTAISTGLPDLPCNAIVIEPANAQTMYVGTDLGVYATTNGGVTWTSYSAGMPQVVVDDLALHPVTGMLRAATHGRGVWQTPTVTPAVAVLSPNGDEAWTTGTAQTIRWATGGLGGTVAIELNRNYPAGSWEALATSTANDGTFPWTVGGAATTTARVRVRSLETPAATDVSNENFTINRPQITLLSPIGGESWNVGSTQTINWSLNGTSGNVAVQINRAYPAGPWTQLVIGGGTWFDWTVTAPAASDVRVRVFLVTDSTTGDTCDSDLSILEPHVTLLTPNGGESLLAGAETVIRWTRQNYTGPVQVEFNRNYPVGAWDTLASAADVDSIVWMINAPGTTTARVRVTATGYGAASDVSDAAFTILPPALTVTNPNGGEVWLAGSTQVLRWTRSHLAGPVNVFVSHDYPTDEWAPVAISVSADSVAWTVNGFAPNAARVRVEAVNAPAVYDESNANFSITAPLALLSPNGGERWAVGLQQSIQWTRNDAPGDVTVQVNRAYPSGTWETLTTSAGGTSLAWLVNMPLAGTARVRIFMTAMPSVGDTSNGAFAITQPSLTLQSPNGGEVYSMGQPVTLRWNRSDAAGPAMVLLSRNGNGGPWDTLAPSVIADSLQWTATGTSSTNCRLRVFLLENPSIGDTSAAAFALEARALTLTCFNNGETAFQAMPSTVTFDRSNAPGDVTVQVMRVYYAAGTWETLSTNVNGTAYIWNVVGQLSDRARMRIFLTAEPWVCDSSDRVFPILQRWMRVLSPNGGEPWVIGSQQTFTWVRGGVTDSVRVQIQRNFPSGTWEYLSQTEMGNSFTWTVTGPASNAVRARVMCNSWTSARDTSDADFAIISAPLLTLLQPNGGELLALGQPYAVRFNRLAAAGEARVELCRSYPAGSWELVGLSSTDSLVWTPTGTASTAARLRVMLSDNPATGDTSNAAFTLFQPALTLTSPVGGERWAAGGTRTIRWTRTGITGGVRVEFNSNYPTGTWSSLATGLTRDTLLWTIPAVSTAHARLRVVSEAASSMGDTSADFEIVRPLLTVTAPNGGETLVVGAATTLSFTRTEHPEALTVQLNRNYPAGSWETLATGMNANSIAWTVTGAASTSARLRVISEAYAGVGDTSNAAFTILAPQVNLLTPDGGETWITGTTYTLRWTRTAVTNVDVLLNRAYPGGSWETLGSNLNRDTLAWTVTTPTGSACRVKVQASANPAINHQSAANFGIIQPGLTLTSPAIGDSFAIGLANMIRWTRIGGLAGSVRVDLNRNYPSTTWETLGSANGDSLVWLATPPTASTARLRVISVSTPTAGDTSDANLPLVTASLTLAPVGASLFTGQTVALSWTRAGVGAGVDLFLCRSYPGGAWEALATGITTDQWSWTVTGPRAPNAALRVISTRIPALADTELTTILQPALSLTAPSGTLGAGNVMAVTWTRSDLTAPLLLEQKLNYPGGTWESVTSNLTGESYLWTVPATLTTRARLRLRAVTPAVETISATNLTIVMPALTVVSPNGGEVLNAGSSVTVRWSRTAAPGDVKVELNRDYPGGAWETLAAAVNTDTLVWTASGSFTRGRIRVSLAARPEINDLSNSDFGTATLSLTLAQPNGGETLTLGQANTIRWTRAGAEGAVKVDLNRDYPAGNWEILAVSTIVDSLVWATGGAASSHARVRVSLVADTSVYDISDEDFVITAPALQLTAPLAGDSVGVGLPLDFAWSGSGWGTAVSIEIKRAYPSGTWEMLGSNLTGNTWTWTVAGAISDAVRFRVTSVAFPSLGDTIDGAVHLGTPQLSFTSPSIADTFLVGETVTLSWSRPFSVGDVRVTLSRNGTSGPWEELGVTDGNMLAWTVSGPVTAAARLRVSLVALPAVVTTTAFDCAIATPGITVTSPVSSTTYPLGRDLSIAWTRTLASGAVTVYLQRNAGPLEPLRSGVTGDSIHWTATGAAAANARIIVRALSGGIEGQSGNFILAAPSLSLVTPTGGGSVAVGESMLIQWERGAQSDPVRIDLNRDYPTGTWTALAANLAGTSRTWVVTGAASSHARLRVVSMVDATLGDTTGSDLQIVVPSLALTPLGSSSLSIGFAVTVSWTRTNFSGPVNIYLSRDGGASWAETLATDLSGGNFIWIPAAPVCAQAKLKVARASDSSVSAQSASFALVMPQLAVTYPAGGETIAVGQAVTLRWTRTNHPAPINVLLSRNYLLRSWEVLAENVNADSLVWAVDGAATNAATLRVVSTVDGAWIAESPNFALQGAALQLLVPAAGTTALVGDTLQVEWQRVSLSAPVRVLLRRVGGLTDTLTAGSAGSLVRSMLRAPEAVSAWVVVETTSGTVLRDSVEVNGPFVPRLTLNAPTTGARWVAGHEQTIRFTRAHAAGAVIVRMNPDFPAGTWTTLGTASSDSLLYLPNVPETSSLAVAVTLTSRPNVADTTYGVRLVLPALTLAPLTPNPCHIGDSVVITWQNHEVDGVVELAICRAYPFNSWQTIYAGTDSGFAWVAAGDTSATARLRLRSMNHAQAADTSELFIIQPASLVFTQPAAAGTDTAGNLLHLAWTSVTAVRLELSRDAENNVWQTVADSIIGGEYDWAVSGPETATLRFRVSLRSNPAIQALSPVRQVVVPELNLAVGGETWFVGESHWIRWDRINYTGAVALEFTAGDRAEPWTPLANNVVADSFLWTVTGPAADLVALRLTASSNPELTDTTDQPLQIALPHISVIAPNGGDTLIAGQQIRLRWTGVGFSGGVGIGLWRGAPVNRFDTLFVDTPNDSSEIWTITGPAAEDCYLIVVSLAQNAIFDTSDTRFTILDPGSPVTDTDPFVRPVAYALNAPYPNPFNSTAMIEFVVPRAGRVSLRIFDMLGREVAALVDDERPAGTHRIAWQADRAASGTYFVRMQSGEFNAVRRLQLIR